MQGVKFALPLVLCLAFATSACNTIENRRSVYAPKKADGPYTRSLQDGTWKQRKSVDQQYEEAKREKKMKGNTEPAAAEPAA
jgi:hypothetical protein